MLRGHLGEGVGPAMRTQHIWLGHEGQWLRKENWWDGVACDADSVATPENESYSNSLRALEMVVFRRSSSCRRFIFLRWGK